MSIAQPLRPLLALPLVLCLSVVADLFLGPAALLLLVFEPTIILGCWLLDLGLLLLHLLNIFFRCLLQQLQISLLLTAAIQGLSLLLSLCLLLLGGHQGPGVEALLCMVGVGLSLLLQLLGVIGWLRSLLYLLQILLLFSFIVHF